MKGIFSERLSKFTRSVIIFFDWWAEIDRPIREELDVFDPSDLESWDEIEKKNGNLRRLGRSEYFAEIRMTDKLCKQLQLISRYLKQLPL